MSLGVPPAMSTSDLFLGEVGHAYSGAAVDWASGPSVVYDQLSEALCENSEIDFAHRLVLDLCAGSGAATAALQRRGAAVVALDLAYGMLNVDRSSRPPAVQADANHLPFRRAAFESVVMAFGLNHSPDPVNTLRSVRPVLNGGGEVAIATFASGWNHPAKRAVDEVLVSAGYSEPSWHAALKRDVEPTVSSPERLGEVLNDAGFGAVKVVVVEVTIAVSVEQAVAWRFGMASHGAFIRACRADVVADLFERACSAVRLDWVPLQPSMLVATARSPLRQ